jgi:hypothetical protein
MQLGVIDNSLGANVARMQMHLWGPGMVRSGMARRTWRERGRASNVWHFFEPQTAARILDGEMEKTTYSSPSNQSNNYDTTTHLFVCVFLLLTNASSGYFQHARRTFRRIVQEVLE